MAATREPRSENDRTLALVHVRYELEMCAASAIRAATPNARDVIEANAYLESTLLHARNLYEFLVANRKSPRDDDLLRTDFTRMDWTASKHAPDAVRRLAAAIPDVHKHLSHLTWARVDDLTVAQWTPLQIAYDVAELVRPWAVHLSAHDRGGVGEAARTLEAVAATVLSRSPG
jgi:hypothetical protein